MREVAFVDFELHVVRWLDKRSRDLDTQLDDIDQPLIASIHKKDYTNNSHLCKVKNEV